MKVDSKVTQKSWSSISDKAAETYLHNYPKTTIWAIAYFIRHLFHEEKCRVLDVGCGNAQIYAAFKEAGVPIRYTGIDFSLPLIRQARDLTRDDSDAQIIESDCYDFFSKNQAPYDLSICSHILELIESPDLLLHHLSKASKFIAIRWYEPPINQFHVTEVKLSAHPEHAESAPYIRRKMSTDYYENLLRKHNLKLLHQQSHHKDTLHILQSCIHDAPD